MQFQTASTWLLLSLFLLLVSTTNDLKFKLDQAAAEKGYFLFSTILPMSQDLTDQEIYGIARDALLQMKDKDSPTGWKKSIQAFKNGNNKRAASEGDTSTVVTAMLDTDQRRLYLSSSMKRLRGQSSFRMNLDGTLGSKSVNKFLEKTCMRCSIAKEIPLDNEGNPKLNHQNQASCGEVMALHAWDLVNGGTKLLGDSLHNGKIVAIAGDKPTTVKIKAPCAGDGIRGGYGCFDVLADAKLTALPENTVLLDVAPDVSFADPLQKSVIC